MTGAWGGRRVTEVARPYVAAQLPAPCGKCARTVEVGDSFVVGHILDRATHPHLMWEPNNWQPEHRGCSDSSGQAAVIAKARAEGRRDAMNGQNSDSFPRLDAPGQPWPLPAHTHGNRSQQVEVREGLSWAELCLDAPAWLAPYLDVPEDGAPPLWVSSVHPEAVGSLGPEAIEWMESNIVERGRPLRLRWWQKLAIVLQLQCRADGSLCWRVVLESGPRRIGKSVRLRAMALWRLRHGPALFEPEQLVLHCGKDLAIVREVMRKAWAWAGPLDDWDIKKGMTEPEVSYDGVNRWVARSKDATTGYDCCLALCDESWDVPPASIDDDLEPAMLERESPQLVLTSTAHRRATSLMPGRILDVLANDDGETMLLLWGVLPGADAGDPVVWRSASPHWTEDREQMMATKYAKAQAGEVDPEADDLDPMQGFLAQYLNLWRLRTKRKRERGEPIISEVAWGDLVQPVPVDDGPAAAAIESWFEQGVSLVLAWSGPDYVTVMGTDHVDLEACAAALRESGYRGPVTVGASLLGDPALSRVRTRKGEGRTGATAQELARLLAEDVLRHDGGEHLTEQVLALRTSPGADGPRLTSTARADAVKAVVWAVRAARKPRSGITGMVVASGVGR